MSGENKQTLLGAGGAIANVLAKELTAYTSNIRLVGRNPVKVNDTDELFQADLSNAAEIHGAIEGSSIVYVTIGFPYSAKMWKKYWPPFIDQVITSCKEHQAKLVFFDNIYMYDANHLNGMTEETPINPPSKKGAVRAELVKMIMDEVDAGNLTALIARCADYYGPGVARNGMLREMVLNNYDTGKKANWLSSVDFKHSITYVPDAGKATAILGNTEDAYNQVWHLPTADDPPTGKEWIEAAANEMQVKPSFQIATKLIMRIMGIFIPILREMPEMMYQYDRDYVFDSSKFEKRFDFTPTSYQEGLNTIIKTDYPKQA